MGRIEENNLILIDTNIFIEFAKNHIEAIKLFNREDLIFALSHIAYAEIFVGAKSNEEESFFKKIIDTKFKIKRINDQVIEIAIKKRREYKIKLPDALIYATAIYHEIPLYTRNTKDFNKIPMDYIVIPY